MVDTGPQLKLLRLIQLRAQNREISGYRLVQETGLHPPQAYRLLSASDFRGLDTIERALEFLAPDLMTHVDVLLLAEQEKP